MCVDWRTLNNCGERSRRNLERKEVLLHSSLPLPSSSLSSTHPFLFLLHPLIPLIQSFLPLHTNFVHSSFPLPFTSLPLPSSCTHPFLYYLHPLIPPCSFIHFIHTSMPLTYSSLLPFPYILHPTSHPLFFNQLRPLFYTTYIYTNGTTYYYKRIYRVFIKYCVFTFKFGDFSELCQLCCSAGVLPAWCAYTH